MKPRFALPVAAAFALACGGGASVDPVAHLQPLCDAPMAPRGLRLPERPGATGALPEGIGLELTPEETRIDSIGLYTTLPTQLAESLAIRPGPLRVFADAGLPAPRVIEALSAANEAGFREAWLVVDNGRDLQLPPYLDPAYAADFEARLGGLDPSQRATLAARELSDLLRLCPPGMEVFNAVAHAAPESRCELFAYGLSEALPSCPLTSGDKVVTLTQVIVGAEAGPELVGVRVDLLGALRPAEAGATYAEWLRALP